MLVADLIDRWLIFDWLDLIWFTAFIYGRRMSFVQQQEANLRLFSSSSLLSRIIRNHDCVGTGLGAVLYIYIYLYLYWPPRYWLRTSGPQRSSTNTTRHMTRASSAATACFHFFRLCVCMNFTVYVTLQLVARTLKIGTACRRGFKHLKGFAIQEPEGFTFRFNSVNTSSLNRAIITWRRQASRRNVHVDRRCVHIVFLRCIRQRIVFVTYSSSSLRPRCAAAMDENARRDPYQTVTPPPSPTSPADDATFELASGPLPALLQSSPTIFSTESSPTSRSEAPTIVPLLETGLGTCVSCFIYSCLGVLFFQFRTSFRHA